MAIVLADLLDPKLAQLQLRARNEESALRQLISPLTQNGLIADPELFLQQMLTREKTNPGMVEDGIAFPHIRTDLVEKIALVIGRSRAGIPFGAEGKRAHLIFLIGVPQRLVNDYLVVVGALARILKEDQMRERLMAAATPEEFLDTLRNAQSSI